MPGGRAWSRGCARQGLVPDFEIRLPTPEGLTDRLAERTFIGAGWFPRGVRGKGTDRRAAGLPLMYKRALERLDRSHHNTPPGETGPLMRRFQGYSKLEGLVLGPWG
jgi:hypothetical protein